MGMPFKSTLATAFVIIALFSPASSQPPPEVDFYRQQFADWGGIVFRCLTDDEPDQLQTALCHAATQEARFLAATSDVPFRSTGAKSYFNVAYAASQLGHGLVLEATIRTTKGAFRAVSMRLEAGSFYSEAIEANARPGTPEASPRGGTLVLWERDLVASGSDNSELQGAVLNGFATILKEFFSLFLESRSAGSQ